MYKTGGRQRLRTEIVDSIANGQCGGDVKTLNGRDSKKRRHGSRARKDLKDSIGAWHYKACTS